MKLTFNSEEIEQALISYVSSQGISLSDKQVSVHMTAGRGQNGYSAELDIVTKTPDVSCTGCPDAPKAPVITKEETETLDDVSPFADDKDDVPFNEPADTEAIQFAKD